ncbi:MAG: glycogen debranching N-terminal domain-containing protein [Acidimicrobiales bacterium]
MATSWSVGAQAGLGGISAAGVTLVEGTSFVISTPSGDIVPGDAEGLFYRDTRYLSAWRLAIDERPIEALSVVSHDPFAATFLGRVEPEEGRADSTVFVVRDRFIGDGMREDVVLRNLGGEATACTLSVAFEADFAHLFAVKGNRVTPHGEAKTRVEEGWLFIDHAYRERRRGIRLRLPDGATVTGHEITLDVVVPARGEWRGCFEIELEMDGELAPLRYRCGERVEYSTPATRLRKWERSTPDMTTDDDSVNRAIARSILDLGALRIFDPAMPSSAVVAAGAPWFMTLFGRDSIITSWMTLMVDPSLALSTLRTLARYQGRKTDPRTEEEPGRILHEIRSGITGITDGESIYYGSTDSTPLFVMLLGELHDFGADPSAIDELLPAADRAIDWIENFGDRDGDGFVEYQRATDRGLINQGWKDSYDGINFAGGRIAEAPIALCEVQGYVYAAYRARARIARSRGDEDTASRCDARAMKLREAFNSRYFLEDRGYLAVGLDAEKRPIDSLTSNIGHCLWAGILDDDKAERVAKQLLSTEMFTGWGIRTLASNMGSYNPVSYHNGSVWPHDNAICAAGLMRYGFVEEAQTVALSIFEASALFDSRLPELFCGFAREEFAAPVGYPTSCSPQAWSAATPFSLLRTLLSFEPDVNDRRVYLGPAIPESLGTVRVEQVPVGTQRVTIEARGENVEVSGLDGDLELVVSRRAEPTR